MPSVLGTRLFLLIGNVVPTPAPLWLMEAFESAEVNERSEERSGFQVTFRAGRAGPLGRFDYQLLQTPLLQPGSGITLMVVVGGRPHVLISGQITQQELPVMGQPGASKLTVTGEDLSCVLDRTEVKRAHPNLSDGNVVRKILLLYAHLGIKPIVVGEGRGPRLETDGVRMQVGTDYAYLRKLAQINGYVFCVEPGMAPGVITAYFGPRTRPGPPQRTLSVNMGPNSTVESITFRYDSLAPELVSGTIIDRTAGVETPIPSVPITAEMPLAAMSALIGDVAIIRQALLEVSAASASEALELARARTSESASRVLAGTGELDTTRYGGVLRPRSLVTVRGAGFNFNGMYLVDEVTHSIRVGSYRQQFTLRREGRGSTTAAAPSMEVA